MRKLVIAACSVLVLFSGSALAAPVDFSSANIATGEYTGLTLFEADGFNFGASGDPFQFLPGGMTFLASDPGDPQGCCDAFLTMSSPDSLFDLESLDLTFFAVSYTLEIQGWGLTEGGQAKFVSTNLQIDSAGTY